MFLGFYLFYCLLFGSLNGVIPIPSATHYKNVEGNRFFKPEIHFSLEDYFTVDFIYRMQLVFLPQLHVLLAKTVGIFISKEIYPKQ